ncbi:MAG: AAA family ATPase, partial [Actinobacteria bacterium]|nr:AAA family ATPase [Actinomycetota bacterium]
LHDVGEPVIMTYNAFGAQLLKEHALRIGLEPDARVVVDALKYQLAFRVVANTEVDLASVGFSPMSAVSDMMTLDQALANYMVEPFTVAQYCDELVKKYLATNYENEDHAKFVDTLQKRSRLCALISEYRQAKINHSVIDYSDQIRLAALAARESPAMREKLREDFDIVLLDEYQDTSISQRDLLMSLFGNSYPIMAVGDPCQAIYRWRGAEISNMDNFAIDFPVVRDGESSPCPTYSLTKNRRSSSEILAAANDLSAPVRAIHDNVPELVVGREDLPPACIETNVFSTFPEEIDWIASRIAQLGTDHKWNECAVLVREKKNVDLIVERLEAVGVPVQVADAASLFAMPEVREVLSYLQVLADPCANPSLVRILQGPRWAIGARDLAILGKHGAFLSNDRPDLTGLSIDAQLEHIVSGVDRADRVSLLDALELSDDPTFSYSDEARLRMKLLAAELRELRRHLGESTVDIINRIIRVTGLGVEAMIRNQHAGGTRFDRLATLLDVAGNFSDIDGQVGLQAFLAFVSDSDRFNSSVEAELPLNNNAVTVMSIHKAKGLEFPIVALPGITKNVFPSTVAEHYWVTRPAVIPPAVLTTASDPGLLRFPGIIENFKKDYDEFKLHSRSLSELDETRLAYVAVTRAQHTLLATSSWWGRTQSRRRGPSIFMDKLHEHDTAPGNWCPDPGAQAKNPLLEYRVLRQWPAKLAKDVAAHIRKAAQLVLGVTSDTDSELSVADREQLSQWDQDIEVIVQRATQAPQQVKSVRLPGSLTASQVLNLAKDPEGFAQNLVRPMPRQPSAVADRGTRFHAWVETFYGVRGLYLPDELPGSVDSQIYSDQDLDDLCARFKSGRFSERTPSGMEVPFALVVAGRTIRGRIDAVFTGSLDDPTNSQQWLVVDWKTGPVGSADELQLAIYRHAWAKISGIDPDQVSAAFYYVADDVVVKSENPLSLEKLEELIHASTSTIKS